MPNEREQAIRYRAYAIWEQDGRPEGRSLAHWSQAEAEIGTEQTVSAMEDRKRVKSRPARGVVKQPLRQPRLETTAADEAGR
jgi:Protein of unknown function (DUF2934)